MIGRCQPPPFIDFFWSKNVTHLKRSRFSHFLHSSCSPFCNRCAGGPASSLSVSSVRGRRMCQSTERPPFAPDFHLFPLRLTRKKNVVIFLMISGISARYGSDNFEVSLTSHFLLTLFQNGVSLR